MTEFWCNIYYSMQHPERYYVIIRIDGFLHVIRHVSLVGSITKTLPRNLYISTYFNVPFTPRDHVDHLVHMH